MTPNRVINSIRTGDFKKLYNPENFLVDTQVSVLIARPARSLRCTDRNSSQFTSNYFAEM